MPHSEPTGRDLAWSLAALGWATAASLILLLAPTTARVSHELRLGPAGEPVRATETSGGGLLAEEPRIRAILAAPVALAALPLLAPRRRWWRRAARVSAGLLAAFCLVGLASVGLLYAPSAVAMILAAAGAPRRRTAAPPAP